LGVEESDVCNLFSNDQKKERKRKKVKEPVLTMGESCLCEGQTDIKRALSFL
jgi:hypothetical protein